jgi:hypothetical protein
MANRATQVHVTLLGNTNENKHRPQQQKKQVTLFVTDSRRSIKTTTRTDAYATDTRRSIFCSLLTFVHVYKQCHLLFLLLWSMFVFVRVS